MPFPEVGKAVFRRNLLREVICQFRFPSILRITSELPAGFQERIRNRYPVYERETPGFDIPKEVSEMMVGVPMLQGLQTPTHNFLAADKKRFVSLNEQFLALTERSYTRWSDFRDELYRIEEAFRETYAPSFYDRLGLRYKNVIDKSKLGLIDDPWSSLLNHSLIGSLASSDITNDVIEIRNQTLLKLQRGSNHFIRIAHGLPKGSHSGQVYVVDADIFSEERRDIEHAFETLDNFNTSAFEFFSWFTTERLRNALEPVRN